MVHVGMKVFLLSLAGVIIDKFEGAEGGRFEQTPQPLYSRGTTDFNAADRSFQGETSQKSNEIQDVKWKINSQLKSLLAEAEICRKNYPNLSERSFGLKLYGFLLDELAGTPNKTSIFYCSINKRLVDNVREKIHQLEVFQKNFVPNPKNNSTESPEEDTQQRNPRKDMRSRPSEGFKGGVENDFSLNLEDEWKAKVPYKSHIYLGSSLFPILTEESRIIVKETTTPTSSTSIRTGMDLQKRETVARVYQLLTPSRWIRNAVVPKNATHLKRNIRSLLGQKQESGKLPVDTDNELFHDFPIPEIINLLSERLGHKKITDVGSPAVEVIRPFLQKNGNNIQKALYFLYSNLGERMKKFFVKFYRKLI